MNIRLGNIIALLLAYIWFGWKMALVIFLLGATFNISIRKNV